LVRLGHVALDGTKLRANASKHKAMSYGRMKEKITELEAQVAELLAEAEAVDAAEDAQYGQGRRGDELPEELRFRQRRLEKIRQAKAALEAEARAEAQGQRLLSGARQAVPSNTVECLSQGMAPWHLPRETSMKKQAKKLVLAKETVRSLEADLRRAAGGVTDPACTGSGVVCSYSAPYYCPREPNTRGSACNP
jgi:hypothetical protein